MTIPRNGISLYIYILYLYFSGFFVFFDVFCPILDFIDFLCTIAMFFDVFWKSIPSLRYSHFFTFFLSILFFGSFDFLSFFCHFLSILFLDGSCRMWHQSGDFFFAKNPKKSKKVEKMTKKGVKKKGSKLDLFVPPPFLVKNRVFCLANSPPSGYFSKIGPLTTVVFLYSPCSCRRGRSVWRQLFSPLFPGTLL